MKDDPRYTLDPADNRLPWKKTLRTDFVLDKFDPSTLLCIFKPEFDGLIEWCVHYKNARERTQSREFARRSITMLATGSLRRAEPGERHLKGLTVAANPERYPNPYGLLRPQIADEFDGPVSENGKELPKRVADHLHSWT